MHIPFDSSSSLLGIYFCRYSSKAPKCSMYKVMHLTLFEIANNNTTKLQYTHSRYNRDFPGGPVARMPPFH